MFSAKQTISHFLGNEKKRRERKQFQRSSLSISLSTSCCLTLLAFAILPQTFLISLKVNEMICFLLHRSWNMGLDLINMWWVGSSSPTPNPHKVHSVHSSSFGNYFKIIIIICFQCGCVWTRRCVWRWIGSILHYDKWSY